MNVLALCAGAGGLELGLGLARPEACVICYVEREAFAAAHLVDKMQAGALAQAPIWSDLRTFEGERWRGVVDCIAAGFPCQPFSPAGKRLGPDDDRNAWPDITRIIRDVRPGLVFLENVPDLLTRYGGQVFGDLAALGFDAEWGVFSAAEVGAPHLRRRLFILAAHPQRHRLWDEPERSTRGREHVQGCGQAVSGDDGEARAVTDTNRRGQQGLRIPEHVPEQSPHRGKSHGLDKARRGGGEAPNTNGEGLQRAEPEREEQRRSVSTWGPWTNYQMPEPAIRRVDDGVANRVDRLRLCGNGVVPQQAARAWIELHGRFQR